MGGIDVNERRGESARRPSSPFASNPIQLPSIPARVWSVVLGWKLDGRHN